MNDEIRDIKSKLESSNEEQLIETLKQIINQYSELFEVTGINGKNGINRNYGNVATNNEPETKPVDENGKPITNHVDSFDPKYLTIVYVKFREKNNQPAITIRHGYQSIDGVKSERKRQRIAEKLLLQAKRTARWERRNDLPNNRLRREIDFLDFNFDSQNLIYIYVDNENIEFDDRRNANGKMQNLVRFTKFTSEYLKPTVSNQEAEPNNSFFNASILQTQSRKLTGSSILRLENWYTDKYGRPVPCHSELLYSMNIHLMMETDDGQVIPIILDPDTGNGWGNEP